MTWAAVGVKGWLVTGRHLPPITATRHNPERDRLLRKQGSDVIVQCFGGDSLALVSLILTVMMRSKPHLSIAAAGGWGVRRGVDPQEARDAAGRREL